MHTDKTIATIACSLCGGDAYLLYDAMSDRLHGTPGKWQLWSCDCGHCFINPMPDADQLAAAYANYYTHQAPPPASALRKKYELVRQAYLARRFGYPDIEISIFHKILASLLGSLPHRRAALNASVMWLNAKVGGTLLEIGCGNGTRLALLEKLGWKVTGIEPDPTAAVAAQQQGLEVINGTLIAAKLNASAFDAIVMSHVIEHVAAPHHLLKECLRLLKPDGNLVMLTPNTESLGHRWFGQDWLHLDPPRHLHLFTGNALSSLCKTTGFSSVSCTTTLRDANWTLGGSLALRRRDHYRIGKLSFTMRLLGLLMLGLEWLCLLVNPERGEDLLVIARHNGDEGSVSGV
jgi:2-polyprenyl-3-methyl-5-hydroxy-6-metoxy-1,4-benzoquinol methylase